MLERGHDNSYRAAFLTASAELNEVFREVEQLRIRKDRVEKVMEALKPLLESNARDYERDLVAVPFAPEPAQAAVEYEAPSQPAAAAPVAPRNEAPVSADPIQRRINSILGLAVA